jgi:hypothetical protein
MGCNVSYIIHGRRHQVLNDIHGVDALPFEVVALCSLLARIMHRCLVEQDAHFMAIISLPVQEIVCYPTVQGSEVLYEQAA